MNNRKPNTESTVGERLRLIVGGIAAVTGFFTTTVIGALSQYSDTWVWVIGLGLIVGGLLLANSMKLIDNFSGLGK
jgi:hypothetical protein